MFSPNQLYDYLRYYLHTNKKDALVRNFIINGSRDLRFLSTSNCDYIDGDGSFNLQIDNNAPLKKSYGLIEMHDQEPIDLNILHHETVKNIDSDSFRHCFSVDDFVYAVSSSPYSPIICHSERNSNTISKFTKNNFIPVHFWSHAITSRYWFNHYRMLEKSNLHLPTHRFGAYIRGLSGSREYRSKILTDFSKFNIDVFCPILFNSKTTIDSDESASIPWHEHTTFDIHIVPETIFNTEKIHLTEKVFKPIVMYQPFILFSGPNSLRYMRDYGFKTFSSVWDESYDTIINGDERFDSIFKLIRTLNGMPNDEYNEIIKKTLPIVEFNRNHFYSEGFQSAIIKEIIDGLNDALVLQEESFYTIPGGTLFHYYDLYYDKIDKQTMDTTVKPFLRDSLKIINEKSNQVANEVIKKYNKLL